MALSRNDIVRVSDRITPAGALRRVFGIPLFLTTDETLPTGAGRVGRYSSFDGVSEAFPESSEPYQAAQVYFQQEPFPRNLVVGRWINTAAAAIVRGNRITAVVGDIAAISDGSLEINGEEITAIDFTGDASFSDVATTLQTALRASSVAVLDDAEVTFNAQTGALQISTGVQTGAAVTLTAVSAGSTGTNVAETLGLQDVAPFQQGADAETVSQALDNILALNSDWYFVTVEDQFDDTDTVLDIAAWVSTRRYMFSAGSSASDVLTTGETTSQFAQLSTLSRQRTFGTWSATEDYKALSIAGRFSSTNFNAANSVITGKFKSLPGTLADNLTVTQVTELNRKGVNRYVNRSGDAIYEEGTTFRTGVFIDVRFALDWFVDAVQVEVYNLLRQNPTKTPQTDDGIASIKNVITEVCDSAVTNGMIAPGVVSAATTADIISTTGNNDFDGNLINGYLVYAAPASSLTGTQITNREAPAFRVWLKGSGAIHFVDININFDN